MPIVMLLYYLLSAFVVVMLIWNFVRTEDRKLDELVQYLVICVPLIMRILRVK